MASLSFASALPLLLASAPAQSDSQVAVSLRRLLPPPPPPHTQPRFSPFLSAPDGGDPIIPRVPMRGAAPFGSSTPRGPRRSRSRFGSSALLLLLLLLLPLPLFPCGPLLLPSSPQRSRARPPVSLRRARAGDFFAGLFGRPMRSGGGLRAALLVVRSGGGRARATR